MNVLVVPAWYPNGKDKLMGIYHKEFTEALNNYGIRANMLFIDRQRLSNPVKYLFMKKKIIEQEKNYKVFIYRMLNLGRISFKLQLNNYVKKMDKAFKNYLKTNEKPDIIHAHVTVPTGYAACILGKKYNIPVVVTEHCGGLERFYNNDPFKEYGLYVLKNSTYSTVSNYMKKIVLKYKNECYIIPNLVNTEPFNNNITRKIDTTFKLVSICALRDGKKLDIAFKALERLINKIDIHLDIIGDGFTEKEYKRICTEMNLDKYVTFLGRKNKNEIANILKDEHALLISSELESFGVPGIEAMASGLPIISTDCLGPPEYIDDKIGIICKVNDYIDMSNSILKLYNNYSKYDSKYIMDKANKYSSKEIIRNTKVIYEKAIKDNL